MCAPTSERRRRLPFINRHQLLRDEHWTNTQEKWMLARRSFVLLLMWPLTLILGLLDTLQHTVLEEPHDYRARKQLQANKGHKVGQSWQRAPTRSTNDRGLLILRRFFVAGRASMTMLVQVIFYFAALHLLQFFGLEALIYALKPECEWLLGRLTGTLYETHAGRRLPISMPGCLGPDLDLPYDPSTSFPEAPSGDGNPSTSARHSSEHNCSIAAGITTCNQPCDGHRQHDRQHAPGAVPKLLHALPVQLPNRTPSPSQSAGISTTAISCYAGNGCTFNITAQSSNSTAAEPSMGPVDTPLNAHFMAMAAKLIYEDPQIIADCLEHRWGFKVHDMQHIYGHGERECWLPDLVWCVASNERAVVLMLKGADPVYQLDLRADPPCIKSRRPGVGEVHDGLWAGLHQRDPDCTAGSLVVDRILACLEAACAGGKPLFLCGHSLGGGLASMLSLILPTRWPSFAASVSGVFTFGAPRIGDAETARITRNLYHGRFFRYMHAADMVCSLPPAWGYEHQGLERFILSFPAGPKIGASNAASRVVKEEADGALLRRAKRWEDNWAFPLAVCKIVHGIGKEGWVRLAARAALLPWPGFSDHFPCEYEIALRQELGFSP